MKKYLILVWVFFKTSFAADIEFRMNFTVRIITDMIWYSAQISVFEILFRQSSRIGGWSLEQTRVFLGFLFMVDAVSMIFFWENLDRLSDKIQKGDLDLILAKPINSQFMMSVQRMSTAYVGNLFLALGWTMWALIQMPGGLRWFHFVWIGFLLPMAVLILYGIRFLFASLALIFTKADNIHMLWFTIYKVGTRPYSVYPRWLRFLLLSIIPIGMTAGLPAEILLGSGDLRLVAWMVAVALSLLYFSAKFWNWALKNYSSASS